MVSGGNEKPEKGKEKYLYLGLGIAGTLWSLGRIAVK